MINIFLIKDTTLDGIVDSIPSSIYDSSIALYNLLAHVIITIAIILLASPMFISHILHPEGQYLKTMGQDPNSINMVYTGT